MSDRINALLNRMTLAEKVGQLNHVSAAADTTGATGAVADIESRIRRGEVGTLPGGLDPHLVPTADQSGVPVILMSGHPDMVESVPGARPFILKPFSLSALLATIERVVP